MLKKKGAAPFLCQPLKRLPPSLLKETRNRTLAVFRFDQINQVGIKGQVDPALFPRNGRSDGDDTDGTIFKSDNRRGRRNVFAVGMHAFDVEVKGLCVQFLQFRHCICCADAAQRKRGQSPFCRNYLLSKYISASSKKLLDGRRP